MKRAAAAWIEEDLGDDFDTGSARADWSNVVSVWLVTGFAVTGILMLSAWLG
ncbi:MAG: hypothetical protein KGJ44_08800 [Betaproteobacteria bacterium]|nr:hypothetical protein [Betaproteobacteria bacterium]MDE2048493.1 hypothetical protein [Betaproteobacteria bacterium]